MKKKDYLKPAIVSIEVEAEQSLLAASGITGSGSDFGWDDDDNNGGRSGSGENGFGVTGDDE